MWQDSCPTVFHVKNSLTSGPHVNIHVVIETVAWGSTSEQSSISGRFVNSVDLCYAAGYLGMSILQEPEDPLKRPRGTDCKWLWGTDCPVIRAT